MITRPRAVASSAPTRVCDCGGWTDTWFARTGAVFHVAVEPRVHVRLTATARAGAATVVSVEAASLGHEFSFVPGGRPFGAHPLIEAAVESVGVPDGYDLAVRIHSEMPPGASTGTSGALCVALVGALRCLAGLPDDPLAVARAAHAVETDRLAQQCGVQDQVAAACGGINYVSIPDYPSVEVTPLRPDLDWLAALDARMLLIYLGRGHRSSAVHEAVIREAVANDGALPPLETLRQAARDARDAVLARDFEALGRAMVSNTEAQRRLHASLVGADASAVIAAAAAAGALGWKVNGAGGDGGSVIVLAADESRARVRLEEATRRISPDYRIIPIRCATEGLVVGTPGVESLHAQLPRV